MTSLRRASCACGQLELEVEGEPERVSVCHCLECQKRTGSAFGAQARFAEDRVRPRGRSSVFARKGDSGRTVSFRFCPECGSTVYWSLEALPGFVAVAMGAFADPSFPKPFVEVYEDRRHAWARLDLA